MNLNSSLLSTSVVARAEQLRFGPLGAEEDSDRIYDDRSNKEIEKHNNGDCTEARFPWSSTKKCFVKNTMQAAWHHVMAKNLPHMGILHIQ